MRVNILSGTTFGVIGERILGFEVPLADEALTPQAQPPQEVAWVLIPHLTQILVPVLCHSVDVLAPTTRQLLTFDPPPGDVLSLRDIFCPFGKDTQFLTL